MQVPRQFRQLPWRRPHGFTAVAGPLGDWHALLNLLRHNGIPVTVDREARFAGLLWRLAEAGVSLDDPKVAADYLSPVLSATSDDQRKVREILEGWLQREAGEGAGVDPGGSLPTHLSAAGALRRFDLRRVGIALAAAVALLVVVAAVWGLGIGGEVFSTKLSVEDFFRTSHPVVRIPWLSDAMQSLLEGYVSRLLFCLPALVGLLLVLSSRRAEQARLARAAGEVELIERFGIPTASSDLFRSIAARTAIHDLKRSALVRSDRVDVPRTIAATLRSFGWPIIHMASWRSNREIVLLVDVDSAVDHTQLLGDALEARLRAADALMTRYDFRLSPGRVRFVSGRIDGPAVDDFAVIANRHLHQKLIIVSDGEGLFDRGYARLDGELIDQFGAFASVTLLTPTPEASWGDCERAFVAAGIFVAPLSVNGLEQIADLLRRDPEEPFIRLSRSIEEGIDPFLARLAREHHRYASDQPPPIEEIDQLARRLHLWMGSDENMSVLAAAAVFPKIDPRLTLALGRLVLGRQPDDGLVIRLARLPWMRDGRMPDWLRIALFNRLSGPAQAQVRGRIVAMLDTARKPDGDDAWRRLEERLAMMEVALPKDDLLPNLPAAGPDMPSEFGEHIFLSFIRGRQLDPVEDALQPEAPRSMIEQFGGAFDRRTRLLVIAFGLLALALFALQQPLSSAGIAAGEWAWKAVLAPLQVSAPAIPFVRSIAVVSTLVAYVLWGWTAIRRPDKLDERRRIWLSLAAFGLVVAFFCIGAPEASSLGAQQKPAGGPPTARGAGTTVAMAAVVLVWLAWSTRAASGLRDHRPFDWDLVLGGGWPKRAIALVLINFPAIYAILFFLFLQLDGPVARIRATGLGDLNEIFFLIVILSILWALSIFLLRSAVYGRKSIEGRVSAEIMTDFLFPFATLFLTIGVATVGMDLGDLIGQESALGALSAFVGMSEPGLLLGYIVVALRLEPRSSASLIRTMVVFCIAYWAAAAFGALVMAVFLTPSAMVGLYLFVACTCAPWQYLLMEQILFYCRARKIDGASLIFVRRRLFKTFGATLMYTICVFVLLVAFATSIDQRSPWLSVLFFNSLSTPDAAFLLTMALLALGISYVLPLLPALRYLSPEGLEFDLAARAAQARGSAGPAPAPPVAPPAPPDDSLATQLASIAWADDQMMAIWITFLSPAGCHYRTVFVFEHVSGTYILLSSKDRQHDDFDWTLKQVAMAFDGVPEPSVTDRSDDISCVVRVADGFTRRRIAEGFEHLASRGLREVKLEVAYPKQEASGAPPMA